MPKRRFIEHDENEWISSICIRFNASGDDQTDSKTNVNDERSRPSSSEKDEKEQIDFVKIDKGSLF